MMMVWKFPLRVTDTQLVQVPEHFEPLSVQAQNGELCMWALVNPNAQEVSVRIEIYGTGHPIATSAPNDYIGTVQMLGLEGHVFLRRIT